MIEIALYNSLQHVQFRQPADRLVLARHADGTWRQAEETGAQALLPMLEVRVQEGRAHFQFHGDPSTFADQKRPPGSRWQSELPAVFALGDTWVELGSVTDSQTRPRRKLQRLIQAKSASPTAAERGPAPATLTRWLQVLRTLHRWTPATPEFYAEAARFVVDPIGLDGAFILLRHENNWQVVGTHLPKPELGICYDPHLLQQLLERPQTQYEAVGGGRRRRVDILRNAEELESRLQQLGQNENGDVAAGRAAHAVVVAPLVDEWENLIGAVYGYRAVHAHNGRRAIRPLEARLVDLLAASVSCGIARLEREATAARSRVLFEQAFSPTVASVLERDPAALAGREREVTVLFADLRNFSSICAALSTGDSYELLSHVMDELTEAVFTQDGVVIDYYGDGLAAMWNAPLDQPAHAAMACAAALAMLDRIPAVSDQWQRRLSRELRIGIGIHTGPATVGNVGSRRRLKYGPRGATVNTAARVETATKKLRLPVLITGATAQRLTKEWSTFRVCQAGLSGISEAIDLYAVMRPVADAAIAQQWDRYHTALSLFETGQLDEAEELIADARLECKSAPFRFLSEEIEARLHRRLGRRSTDVCPMPSGREIAIDLSP